MTTMNAQSIDDARARAYTALAFALDRPDDDLEVAIEGGDLSAILDDVATTLDLEAFERAAADIEDTQPSIGELSEAYADAFGLEGDGEVSLYELAYAPGTLVTNTDQLADIAGFYRAFGLDIVETSRDRADKLAIELEYLGFLGFRREQYNGEGDDEGLEIVEEATQAFLEDHVGRWIPRLVEVAHDEGVHPLYRSLLEALGGLVEADVERFDADPIVFEATPTAPLESITDFDDTAGRLELSCGVTPPTATQQHPSEP